MAALPEPIALLINALSQLPGVGPRSAERIALHLVQAETGAVRQLAEAILHARERVRFCDPCGALTEQSPCAICADPRRDGSLVCVVERPVDILSLEKSRAFGGQFIDGRAGVAWVTVAAEVIGTKRIDADENDIGAVVQQQTGFVCAATVDSGD